MTKHIIAVIDRSGSMLSIADDMNGGLRTWLGEISATDPAALLTSILFDHEYEETNVRTPLEDVKPSTLHIMPRGSTALNDAVMRGLGSIKKDEDALVLIVTDGMENASTEATTEQVKKRITALEKKGVIFQYLSASPSAFDDADAYGINRNMTITYAANTTGTQVVSNAITRSSTTYLANDKEDSTWQDATKTTTP